MLQRGLRAAPEPAMIEQVFAAIVLALCLVLLVRLVLGRRRRARFDALLRHWAQATRRTALRVWHWRSSRKAAELAAERAAADAIRRAQRGARETVQREGNVYRPKSFRNPRKPH